MRVREIRIELIIATLALCASAAASIATVVQTRVVGNQLSASVWPYLSFDTTVSPGRLQLSVDNDGLGPALIRDARLRIDGKPVATWRDAFKILNAKGSALHSRLAHTGKVTLDESDVRPGSVIRPGVTLNMFELKSPVIDYATGSALQKRVEVELCYCSVLGQCWNADLQTQDEPPREVANCPSKGSAVVY